jgi:hypothetical protein
LRPPIFLSFKLITAKRESLFDTAWASRLSRAILFANHGFDTESKTQHSIYVKDDIVL